MTSPSGESTINRRRLLLSCGTAGTLCASALYFLNRDEEPRRVDGMNDAAPGARSSRLPARAKNVIFLLMAGAPSQVDLCDPKPELQRWAGKPFPEAKLGDLHLAFTRPTAHALPSWRTFRKHGESGLELSDWLPETGTVADHLCLIRSMRTDAFNHHPGQSLLLSGTTQFGRPSLGSWVTYGLGSAARNLPGFVVMTSGDQGPEGGTNCWSNGFLPSSHRGVPFRLAGDALPYLSSPPGVTEGMQQATVAAVRGLNSQRQLHTGDSEISARIESYELAFRMQMSAPELLDISSEPRHIQQMYGLEENITRTYGTQCLLARRMVERGVRFVMLANSTWDSHSFLDRNHTQRCGETDRPVAALIRDLAQRDLLNETLVVWGGEFGRTPMAEHSRPEPAAVGRDHHADGFSVWLAGGGVKAGHVHGSTDELGLHAAESPVHVHDLQATILHCLGLDHERLTFRHSGRDFRLTDVAGQVVHDILT